MRVLIDCTQISKVKAGVGAYALNLVRELIGLHADLDLRLLVQDDDPDFFIESDRVVVLKVPARAFRKLPLRFLLEQLYIPWLALRYRIDVVHSLHYGFPLGPLRARKVVTVHDLTSFKLPEVHIPAKGRYYRLFIRAARRGADHISFDSQSTQDDFLEAFPRDMASCHVVTLGKAPEFHPDLDPLAVEAVVEKHGLRSPYILYIGMIEPRKNLTRLVEAFSALANNYPSHTLVIAGKKGWMVDSLFEAVRAKGLEGRVVFTGFVSEDDKPYLIRGAEIFAYPSLYEGFGIPVLEALACGTATLTSNLSSMPEVAGDAALLIDPTSTDSLISALSRLLAEPALRQELRTKAVAQAAKFTWRRTAEETYEVYRKAARSR
jgi:glycosyltransferase involved in cell wall biosynthesis